MEVYKVVFLTKSFYPHTGGVEKHVQNISLRLQKKGHHITILTENYTGQLKSKENYKGNLIIRFRYKKLKILGLFNIWVEMIKRLSLFVKADIIHIHDVFIWYLPLRFILFWKKVYLTNHGWEGVYPIPLKNILLKKLSTKLSHKSISVGKYLNKFYGIKSDLITYGAVKMPLYFVKKEKKIVYVGRLDNDTGLPLLIKKLRHYKGYKIEFCGDGPLRPECEKLGVVHGFTDPGKYLEKAEICFASGYLTILEAMSHKCLVVVAYDNALKKSYYQDTPFYSWIKNGNIDAAFQWVKLQSWEKLTRDYLTLWNAV